MTKIENDPAGAAQRATRPALPKRFYAAAGVAERGGAFEVRLDEKPVKTPERRPLALPSRALAELVAAEWAAQETVIDPATMPLTILANVAIDRVAADPGATEAEIAKYAGSDLVCYRASEPAGLLGGRLLGGGRRHQQRHCRHDPCHTFSGHDSSSS